MTIIGLCSVLEYRFKVWTRHKKSGLRLLMETALFHPKYAQNLCFTKTTDSKKLELARIGRMSYRPQAGHMHYIPTPRRCRRPLEQRYDSILR